MIVLIDTDVLLDVGLKRPPHHDPARRLLNAFHARRAEAFVAWHSLSNFHYVARPVLGGIAAKRFIRELLAFARVAPTETLDALRALDLDLSDFEDALQSAAALACGAEAIATRNLSDYKASPVRALMPEDVLKHIAHDHP